MLNPTKQRNLTKTKKSKQKPYLYWGKSLDASKDNYDRIMRFARPRYTQTTHGSRQLSITENLFGSQLLGGQTSNHLGDNVSPIKRSQNVTLHVCRPLQRPTVILQTNEALIFKFKLAKQFVTYNYFGWTDAGVVTVLFRRIFDSFLFGIFHHSNYGQIDIGTHHERNEKSRPRQQIQYESSRDLTWNNNK